MGSQDQPEGPILGEFASERTTGSASPLEGDTADGDNVQFRCPICQWSGSRWAAVEVRPRIYQEIICPRCGCFPRERLIWQFLAEFQAEASNEPLRVLEVGGRPRFSTHARKSYRYANADVTDIHAQVDHCIRGRRLDCTEAQYDVALVSYVLCEIISSEDRVLLLKELHRCTTPGARLILFDDIDLDVTAHQALGAHEFFHSVRLGAPLIAEVEAAGWNYSVIRALTDREHLAADRELPFLLCSKHRGSGQVPVPD